MIELEYSKKDSLVICKKCYGVEDVLLERKDLFKHLEEFHGWERVDRK